MQKLYLILSLVISATTFASDLTCSKSGTALLFINGIDTTLGQARRNAQKTWELGSTPLIDQKEILPDFYYNQSSGKILDAMEAAVQLIDLPISGSFGTYKVWSFFLRFGQIPTSLGTAETRKLLEQRLNEIRNGFIYNLLSSQDQDVIGLSQKIGGYLAADRKVLLVSHSQGNLFANLAYSTMKQSDVSLKLKYYANLQVAPPNSEILAKGLYIRLIDDFVGLVAGSLPGNYAQIGQDWTITLPSGEVLRQDIEHHSFLNTYTSANVFGDGVYGGTMDSIFKQTLFDVAAKLESNCSKEYIPPIRYSANFNLGISTPVTLKAQNTIDALELSLGSEFASIDWKIDGEQSGPKTSSEIEHYFGGLIVHTGSARIKFSNGTIKEVPFSVDLTRLTGGPITINPSLDVPSSITASAMDVNRNIYYVLTSTNDLISLNPDTGAKIDSIPNMPIGNWMDVNSRGHLAIIQTLPGAHKLSIFNPETKTLAREIQISDLHIENFALDSLRDIFYYTVSTSYQTATLVAINTNTGLVLSVAPYYFTGSQEGDQTVYINNQRYGSTVINEDGWLVRFGGSYSFDQELFIPVDFKTFSARWDPIQQSIVFKYYPEFLDGGFISAIDNQKNIIYGSFSPRNLSSPIFSAFHSKTGELIYSVPRANLNYLIPSGLVSGKGHMVGIHGNCYPGEVCSYSLYRLLRTDDSTALQ